jgi:hypothetical protein
MPDHIIDTNVLVVASTTLQSEVPTEHRQSVVDWLSEFRRDARRLLTLDAAWSIWSEYRNNCGSTDGERQQSFGFRVAADKLQTARWLSIDFDGDGHAVLPKALALAIRDRSDRKFVAVALADEGKSSIVNASDTDWYGAEEALKEHGVMLQQLIDAWCRAKHLEKQQRSKKSSGRRGRRSR